MGRKKAPRRTPEQIAHDDFLRAVHVLNAAFGALTCYDSWDDVPKFATLPPGAQSHCHDCLTPHRVSTYPVCPWCKTRAA